jgi:hypothetical protein
MATVITQTSEKSIGRNMGAEIVLCPIPKRNNFLRKMGKAPGLSPLLSRQFAAEDVDESFHREFDEQKRLGDEVVAAGHS